MPSRLILVACFVTSLAAPAGAQVPGPPFELAVLQGRLLGSTAGTLVIGQATIEFQTAKPSESRRWDYATLKQIRILSPTRIVLETFEDQGWLHLGADRSYTFDVMGSITGELVAFLLERVERPMVTAVTPSPTATAVFRVPAKHSRAGRGGEGELVLYDTGLAFLSDREGEARFWRWRDINSVLVLDRYRLLILAYEGGSGETRPFTFELKSELPPGLYDALWQRVNTTGNGASRE